MKKKLLETVPVLLLVWSILGLPASAQVYLLQDGTLFDSEYYAEANPDAAAACGDDPAALLLHYEVDGRAEGRLPHDPAADAAALSAEAVPEPENIRALAEIAGKEHKVYRLEDGTLLDVTFYRAMYQDVQASCGEDDAAVIEHYEEYGKAEGRLAHDPAADLAELEESASPVPQDPLTAVSSLESAEKIQTTESYAMSDAVRQSLEAGIRKITDEGYAAGFVMVDLTYGQGIAYNPDGRFYSASTIKGPYVVSLAAGNKKALSQSEEDMEPAVRISDNEAYGRLYEKYGMQYLTAWWKEAGNGDFWTSTGHAHTEKYAFYSPRQLARLWIRNAEYFESGETGEKIGSWFESPNQSVIWSTLHETAVTRSKAGWYPRDRFGTSATADAGIVYAGDRPYVLSIMTDVPSDFSLLSDLTLAIDACHQEMMEQAD